MSDLWLLGERIRNWKIVLGPFWSLPLVGPPTHVGGYTIGPAFYWILRAIRATLEPWFDNLPHAGAVGQAALQSAVDALLLVAIWKRTGSLGLALATVLLVLDGLLAVRLRALVHDLESHDAVDAREGRHGARDPRLA